LSDSVYYVNWKKATQKNILLEKCRTMVSGLLRKGAAKKEQDGIELEFTTMTARSNAPASLKRWGKSGYVPGSRRDIRVLGDGAIGRCVSLAGLEPLPKK
jgi:hypothetical protein